MWSGIGLVKLIRGSHRPIPVSIELTAKEELQQALEMVRRLLDLDVEPLIITTDRAAVTLLRRSLAAALRI